jgi:hypothetical protein
MADIALLQADNDWDASYTFESGGVPAVGLVVTGYVSATRAKGTEAPIHADLTPTMTNTDAQGLTTGTLQGSAITARLTANPLYNGKVVYFIWKSGTDFFAYRTCFVKDHRVAE